MNIQYLVSIKSYYDSGIPIAIIRTTKKAKLIRMLVEVPKPLSIKFAGTVSSNIFGVAQDKIPLANPNTIRPKHME